MDAFLRAAIEEARLGLSEGGIPIGSVLVINGRIVGPGHNRRVQRGSAILHAEMDCNETPRSKLRGIRRKRRLSATQQAAGNRTLQGIENAGRLAQIEYAQATLSPCDMCSGTVLLYKSPHIVVGENRTFQGPEDYMCARGIELIVIDNQACVQLRRDFITKDPDLWNEDIGKQNV